MSLSENSEPKRPALPDPQRLLGALRASSAELPPCTPPRWARGGHTQTLLGHLLPSRIPDLGGTVEAVTLERPEERIITTHLAGTRPLVVHLFHGLAGSTEAGYMRRTAALAHMQGASVYLNNHRGCGIGAGLASEPYHSGRAEDLAAVIAHGRRRYPHHLHVAIGFSLSANALLLLNAGGRPDIPIAAFPDVAIAVNGPLHLDHASRRLTQGANRLYDWNFVRELKAHVRAKEPARQLRNVRTLRDFDEAYTAVAGGFQDRADYYARCSSLPFLAKVSVPTLLLTAEDDPFIEADLYRQAPRSEFTVFHIEPHGGHLGYLTSAAGTGVTRWLDGALSRVLARLQNSL